jgi:hypothetical protein
MLCTSHAYAKLDGRPDWTFGILRADANDITHLQRLFLVNRSSINGSADLTSVNQQQLVAIGLDQAMLPGNSHPVLLISHKLLPERLTLVLPPDSQDGWLVLARLQGTWHGAINALE